MRNINTYLINKQIPRNKLYNKILSNMYGLKVDEHTIKEIKLPSKYALILLKFSTAYHPLRCGPLMVSQWLRHCATNRKVAGSIPDGVIGIFH
jgi:hypothetical protein